MTDGRQPQDDYVPPKEVTTPAPTPTVADVARDNFQKDAFTPPGQEPKKDGLPGDPPAADAVAPGTDALDSLDPGQEFYCSLVDDPKTLDTPRGRQEALERFRTTLASMHPDVAALFEGEFSPQKLARAEARSGSAEPTDKVDPTKKKPGSDGEEKPEKGEKKDKTDEKAPKAKDSIENPENWFSNLVKDTTKKAVSAVSDIVHDAMSYFGSYGEGMLDSLGLTSSTRSNDGQQLASTMVNDTESAEAKKAFEKLNKVENGKKLDAAVGGLIDQSRANGDLTTGTGRQGADKIVDAQLGDGHTSQSVKEMLGGSFKGDIKTDTKTGEKIQTDGKGNTRIESKDGKNVTLKLSDGTVVNQKTGEDGKTTETFLFGKKDGKDGGFMRTTTDSTAGRTNFEYNDGKNYQQQVDLARLVMSKDRYNFDHCNKDQNAIHVNQDRSTLVDETTKSHVGIDRGNGDIVINSRDKDGVNNEVRMRLNSETGAFDFFQRGEDGKDTKLTDAQVEQVKKQLQLTGSGDKYRVGNTEINRQLVSQLLSSGVRQQIRGGNSDGSLDVSTTDTRTGRGLDGHVNNPADGGKTTTKTIDGGKPTGEERIFDPTTGRIDGTDDKGNQIIFDPTTGKLKTPEIDKEKDGADVNINDTDTKIKPDGSVVDADGFTIMDADGEWWGDERDCCGMTPEQFEIYQAEQRADEAQARALGSLACSMIASGNVNVSVVHAAMSVARASLGVAAGIENGAIRALAECAALAVISRGNMDIDGAKKLTSVGEGSQINKVFAANVTIGGPSSVVNEILHDRDERQYAKANNVEDLDAYRRARGLA